MRLVTIRCPQCAATVSVQSGADVARCEYCGASSAISRRTAFLERRVPMPARPEYANLPVAVQKHSRTWIFAIVLVPIALAGVSALVSLRATGILGGRVLWGGGQAIAADVNGDGVADALGLIWNPMSQQQPTYLVAVDGKSGSDIWRSGSLGKYTDLSQLQVAASGTSLLVASPLGTAQGYELSTGKQSWSGVSLGEKPQRICASGDPGKLIVQTADKKAKMIELATGDLSETPYSEDCLAPRARAANTAPGTKLNKWPYGSHDGPNNLAEMRVDWSIGTAEGIFVAFGNKSEGTSVPMVGAYRSDAGEATSLWVAAVPQGNALAAETGRPELGLVDRGIVFVSYETKEDVVRIAAFQVDSGKRLWDVALPKPERGSERASGISSMGESVFVATYSRLHVLARSDGSPLFRYGGM